MVPNQRQLFIVVSDWGSYFGSHFPLVFVGTCLCASAPVSTRVVLLFCSVFILITINNVHIPCCALVRFSSISIASVTV